MALRKGIGNRSGTVEYVELDHLGSTDVTKDQKISAIEFLDTESAKLSDDDAKKLNALPPSSARELVTEILTAEDDPTLVSESKFTVT
jgi:hypothetical protein